MAITFCKDCECPISSAATKCPHCRSFTPHGVNCLVCEDDGGVRFSVKKAHSHPHPETKNSYNYSFYHPECVEKTLAIPKNVTCPECRTSLSRSWNWEELCESHSVSCKRCGLPRVFSIRLPSECRFCNKCRLPIFSFHRYALDDYYLETYYHESCWQVVRRLREQKKQEEQQKETSGGCMVLVTIVLLPVLLFILTR